MTELLAEEEPVFVVPNGPNWYGCRFWDQLQSAKGYGYHGWPVIWWDFGAKGINWRPGPLTPEAEGYLGSAEEPSDGTSS